MINVYTPPTAPIRLMTAFPLLRSLLGVKSGIRATAGDRYSPMDTKSANSAAKNKTRLPLLSAAGRISIKITASSVPHAIKGILLPIFVSTLSDSAPKTGSKNNANTLSAAISAPVTVSPSPKVFCKISGMILSYICQNADMDKNASPTKKVRL